MRIPLSHLRWAPTPTVNAAKAQRSEVRDPVPADGREDVATMHASATHLEAVKKLVALHRMA